MTVTIDLESAVKAPFGTIFTDQMVTTYFKDGVWSPFVLEPHRSLSLSPAAHVLHYGSACFEGMKAHRRADGVYAYRLKSHMTRFKKSAELLCLPLPDPETVADMIRTNIKACEAWVPDPPGALYIRPTLIGTLNSIGAAATPSTEAVCYILLSPVGDYFKTGPKPLRLLIDECQRTSPDFGMAKAGGNYAAALHKIMEARAEYQVDQVLFAPAGDVQETGAANFLLINDREILTKKLSNAFLHGITRDSILKIGADLGYKISERDFTIDELLEWAKTGEAALSGTAAVLSSVGGVVYRGEEYKMGDGKLGKNTKRLRQALLDIQQGRTGDRYDWLEKV